MTKQQSAEAIAKFLGLIHEKIQSYYKDKPIRKPVVQWLGVGDLCIPNKELIDWLASDTGTVAMIERLVSLRCDNGYVLLESDLDNQIPWRCESGKVTQTGPTLNAALQAAILEVMKNG